MRINPAAACVLSMWCVLTIIGLPLRSLSADSPVHGLWVWKTTSVLEAPGSAETLRAFCKSNGINEVYVSVSSKEIGALEDGPLPGLIRILHSSGIRVEALLGSIDADQAGKSRDHLLEQARAIVQYNEKQPSNRFDGIHLDIEPHQRPENKGAGNLAFLPGLVETYRAVRALAEPSGMIVNADIANKFLKGTLEERKMLMTALPRLTLMLYELSSPEDGKSDAQKTQKLHSLSQKYFEMAYASLSGSNLAKMAIALRTPDYGNRLPDMLMSLDKAHHSNPHYLGWARHSYNDQLKTGE